MKMPARDARLYQRSSKKPRSSATGFRPKSFQTIAFDPAVANALPRLRTAPHKVANAEGKGVGMPSELDRRFDDMLATVIGPGGRLIIERDEHGRAIVSN